MVLVVDIQNESRNLSPSRLKYGLSEHLRRKIPPGPEVDQGTDIVASVSIALFRVKIICVKG